ncbi:mechanosensitive ion channel family protein [Aestuariispira insulae]|uniref:Small-conductance mechanosensitive channel n=1 Tax=Aestuariispira insulae TaxID=1461337 RepID=A0A3D9H3Z3_9PROT|nr:mechanosensitive ion channel family protein [Aestuariispira insulae]RED44205.1 small-conductance mechanosensitive channel [Aestuariispira insulae]
MSITEILKMLGDLIGNQVAASLLLIILVAVIRMIASSYLNHRTDVEGDQRRRILSNLRNGLALAVLIGLIFIWAPALRTFALSLTAFAVAIILATKELILCISGSFLNASSRAIRVGDWIEINGKRGEVVDQALMSTTIQELGTGPQAYQFTGRAIVLPNSIFLAAPVTNEQFYRRFVFHNFYIVGAENTDAQALADTMLQSVRRDMENHQELARRYIALIEKRTGVTVGEPEPKARFTTTNEGRVSVSVTAFIPTREISSIEQRAIKAGLDELQRQSMEKPESAQSHISQMGAGG